MSERKGKKEKVLRPSYLNKDFLAIMASKEEALEIPEVYQKMTEAWLNFAKIADKKYYQGSSLGLQVEDSAALIELVKEGLPLKNLKYLSDYMNVTLSELAKVLCIPDRTLARRRKEGRLHADESDRLLRIGLLFETASRVLGGRDQAQQWLKTPKKALGGKIPLEYADTEIGAREVEDLLGRIEHGVFS